MLPYLCTRFRERTNRQANSEHWNDYNRQEVVQESKEVNEQKWSSFVNSTTSNSDKAETERVGPGEIPEIDRTEQISIICPFLFFLKKKKKEKEINNNEEFDPGSGWTLATGLTHASRGAAGMKLASSAGDRRTGE